PPRPPGVDVKPAGRAVQAFRPQLHDILHRSPPGMSCADNEIACLSHDTSRGLMRTKHILLFLVLVVVLSVAMSMAPW
ncbi:hypothetical protein, partial [Achromobacter sp. AGC39]